MISLEMFIFLKQVNRKPRFTHYADLRWIENSHSLIGVIEDALSLEYVTLLNDKEKEVEKQCFRITELGAAEVTHFMLSYYDILNRSSNFKKTRQVLDLASFIENCTSIAKALSAITQ